MKQIKEIANKRLELEVVFLETSGETTEHELPSSTNVIETDSVHPREHHYNRSVWIILFISVLLMAVLITMAIYLRICLSENTKKPKVQPKSMLNLIEIN